MTLAALIEVIGSRGQVEYGWTSRAVSRRWSPPMVKESPCYSQSELPVMRQMRDHDCWHGFLLQMNGLKRDYRSSPEFSSLRHCDDDSLIDPMVSGQASTGELSISFGLLVSIGASELTGLLSEIIDRLNDALGLVWPRDPVPRAHRRGATMLNPTSQHLDGIEGLAFA